MLSKKILLFSFQELNAKLQAQEQVLTSRQVEVSRLKEKLNHNEHVLMTAMKKRFNTKNHVDTQDQPAQTEQELKRSWCDAPEESHVSNSTQLQVSCRGSSVYFTIISLWILTACVGLLQNQLFM